METLQNTNVNESEKIKISKKDPEWMIILKKFIEDKSSKLNNIKEIYSVE